MDRVNRIAMCPYCGKDTPASYDRADPQAVCPCGAREIGFEDNIKGLPEWEDNFQLNWVAEHAERRQRAGDSLESARLLDEDEALTGWYKPEK